MRSTIVGCLGGLLALVGCTKEEPKCPVDQILEIGVQAEKDIAENAAKKAATTDLSEAVELGKKETAIVDSAVARIQAILGGRNQRLALPVGPCNDTLPVVFGHATIGMPDFHKGEFRINLVLSAVGKRPLPEGTFFQLSALDSTGKVLSSRDASMVDSLRIGDSLFAGGMFRGTEIQGLRSLAAK